MKQCIFCREIKEDSEFNVEHIILYSLGGEGSEDLISNVCTSCNSKLGTNVDAFFMNHQVAKYQRYYHKIKGRNGVPNFLEDREFEYADTKIKGKIIMDKQGNISGFRASFGMYSSGDKKIVYAPRKNAERYAKSMMEKNGFSNMTKLDLGEPLIPHINRIEFDEELRDDYLLHAYPLMLKMAYEFCVAKIGDIYINDDYANDIRKFLVKFSRKDTIMTTIPADACLEWGDNTDNKISIKLYSEDNKLFVNIRILGFVNGKICVSQNADKYELCKVGILEIEVADKV